MSRAALPHTEAVGVVGCGTMGVGIAQVALAGGHPVTVYDTDPTSARRAVDRIAEVTDRLVAKGRLPGDQRAEMLDRLSVAASLADLGHAGLVVEAAVEDLTVKQGIFTELEAACADDAVLASNTSSISITAIAAALRRPQRVVGMHFFNPAPLMKLVEVVDALQTDEQVVESVAATATAWDKVAIRVSSTPGFVVNRVARPFYTEALRVVAEQAGNPATVDAVMRESGGFRMGPFALMDLIGLDVNLAVTRSVWAAFHYDPRYTPALAQEELVAAGRLGRKTGRGWYDYAENATPPEPATAPRQQAPATFLGPTAGALAQLVTRLEAAGLEHSADAGAAAPDPSGVSLPGGGLRVTDGRSATEVAAELGRPVVLVDLALDYSTASRFALAASDGCPSETLAAAVGLLQHTGAGVSVVDDVPGLFVARTVAMLVNEAADVVGQGVATVEDVDLAMRHGVNYPVGPLEWGRQWGFAAAVEVLDHLAAAYGDGHYRVAPWLRRQARIEHMNRGS